MLFFEKKLKKVPSVLLFLTKCPDYMGEEKKKKKKKIKKKRT